MTACRARVRYGRRGVRPIRGTGSGTAAQTCIRIRAQRSGSSRSASSGSVTQGTPGPVDAGGVAGGGDEQVQSFGGAAGGGEQVGAGDDGPDVCAVAEREEVEIAAGRGGDPGERLVGVGQGRGQRQRGGEVAGGVGQVALVECEPGEGEFLRRGQRGWLLRHVVPLARRGLPGQGKPRRCWQQVWISCALLLDHW